MKSAATPQPLLPDWQTLTDSEILDRLGGVYEHSRWVARAILADGIGPADRDPELLATRMRAVVNAAGPAAHLTLLKAHPELAGKLALAGKLEAHSSAEQAGAGLDQCSEAEFTEFQCLNAAYTQKFGHPFIIAVRGLSRAEILKLFQLRIENSASTEFATALAEVHKIASQRLAAMVKTR